MRLSNLSIGRQPHFYYSIGIRSFIEIYYSCMHIINRTYNFNLPVIFHLFQDRALPADLFYCKFYIGMANGFNKFCIFRGCFSCKYTFGFLYCRLYFGQQGCDITQFYIIDSRFDCSAIFMAEYYHYFRTGYFAGVFKATQYVFVHNITGYTCNKYIADTAMEDIFYRYA